jgi:hypothetical protein
MMETRRMLRGEMRPALGRMLVLNLGFVVKESLERRVCDFDLPGDLFRGLVVHAVLDVFHLRGWEIIAL